MTNAIENLFSSILQIIQGFINTILSILQGVLDLIYSSVTHVTKFFAHVVSFVLHNIVTIGIVVGLVFAWQVYQSRQGAAGQRKKI